MTDKKHRQSQQAGVTMPVVSTKLNKPVVPETFIKRPALIDKLETNLHLPLTLVSAPTGCGKSVLTSQWLEETDHTYGWLSIDEEHNDVQVFITYLFYLLKEQYPHQTFGLGSLLEGVDLPPNLIASAIINDLDLLEGPFVLVLDDYHLIKEDKIHQIINNILQYPPEHFHLVILTQRDPPVKLAKIRAQLRLHEVRMKDLAFTKDEAIELCAKIGAESAIEQINTLVKHTDGWITGITAGLMVLADGVDYDRVIQSVNNHTSVISDLFDEVVLKGMPVTTQKFLELTVLLDRFSLDLIDLMIEVANDGDLKKLGIKDYINQSRRRNLFLIPLDSSGQWYRYHHLFRDQLKSQIGTYFTKDKISKLYRTASIWFDEKGFLEEALKYALLSEDMTFAVRLFDKRRIQLFNSEQFQRLERIILLFPSDVIHTHFELSISLAMLQDFRGDFSKAEEYLSQSRLLLEANSNQAQNSQKKKSTGEVNSISAYLQYILGNFDQCVVDSQKSLKLLPANQHNYFREFALAYHVFAKQAQGKAKEGLRILEENLESLSIADRYFRGRLYQLESMVYGMEADTKNMHKSALRLNSLVEAQSFPGAWMAGIYYLATAAYLTNKLEAVHRFHQELWQFRYSGRPFWVIHNIIIMGLASFALGHWDKVKNYINQCLELTSELEIQPLKGMVHAFEVEIALRRNDIDRAIELSALANFEPHPPLFYYYYPQLTRVKLFIQTDKKEKGIELLKELIDLGRKRNNINLLVQALALMATIQTKEFKNEQAKRALSEALQLSENKEIIRTFLDLGDPMVQLLRELAEDQPGNNQIKELLTAFSVDQFVIVEKEPLSPGNKAQQFDTLSNRELEILNLVAKGYKNDEVAEKLYVSLDTIKKHLYNAYQKLYVKNRVNAIKKAKELGVIDEE